MSTAHNPHRAKISTSIVYRSLQNALGYGVCRGPARKIHDHKSLEARVNHGIHHPVDTSTECNRWGPTTQSPYVGGQYLRVTNRVMIYEMHVHDKHRTQNAHLKMHPTTFTGRQPVPNMCGIPSEARWRLRSRSSAILPTLSPPLLTPDTPPRRQQLPPYR